MRLLFDYFWFYDIKFEGCLWPVADNNWYNNKRVLLNTTTENTLNRYEMDDSRGADQGWSFQLAIANDIVVLTHDYSTVAKLGKNWKNMRTLHLLNNCNWRFHFLCERDLPFFSSISILTVAIIQWAQQSPQWKGNFIHFHQAPPSLQKSSTKNL
jgi:hypothetical protein